MFFLNAISFASILSISIISCLAFLSIVWLFAMGFVVGHITLYRRNHVDQQKYELRYRIYDKKWLSSLNMIIHQINSSSDGIPLRLYILFPNKSNKIKKCVIFHHGIKSSHIAAFKHAKYYLDLGYTVVCYDSRGWGDNLYNGFCTYGVLEKIDLLDVVKFIDAKYTPKGIILHGESMGAKTVLDFAINFDYLKYINGYIVDSLFIDFRKVIINNFKQPMPYVPFWLIYPSLNLYIKFKIGIWLEEFDITNNLYKIKSPVLAIHSSVDPVNPISELNKIISRVENLKTFIVSSAPHAKISIVYRKKFITVVTLFLKNIKSGKKERR